MGLNVIYSCLLCEYLVINRPKDSRFLYYHLLWKLFEHNATKTQSLFYAKKRRLNLFADDLPEREQGCQNNHSKKTH